jgi:hypothetical protein
MPSRRRTPAPGRPRARTGAAMVEALVALPVLLALTFALSFMRELHTGKQAALSDARRCALVHAARGCGAEPPAGCEGLLGDGARLADGGATADIVDATRAVYAGSSFQLLENVPALGDALASLFGTTTYAEARRSVRRPIPNDATYVVSGAMTLSCNTRETNVLRAAEDAVCASPGLEVLGTLGLCAGPR